MPHHTAHLISPSSAPPKLGKPDEGGSLWGGPFAFQWPIPSCGKADGGGGRAVKRGKHLGLCPHQKGTQGRGAKWAWEWSLGETGVSLPVDSSNTDMPLLCPAPLLSRRPFALSNYTDSIHSDSIHSTTKRRKHGSVLSILLIGEADSEHE